MCPTSSSLCRDTPGVRLRKRLCQGRCLGSETLAQSMHQRLGETQGPCPCRAEGRRSMALGSGAVSLLCVLHLNSPSTFLRGEPGESVWDLAGCSGAQHLHNHQAGPHRLHLASTRVASSPGKGGWTPACGLPHTQPGVTRELSCKPLSLPLEAPKTAGHVRMPRPAPFRLKSGYPSTSMAGAPAGSPGPSTAVWCCTDLDASLVFEASRSRPHTCTARSGRHRAGPGGG